MVDEYSVKPQLASLSTSTFTPRGARDLGGHSGGHIPPFILKRFPRTSCRHCPPLNRIVASRDLRPETSLLAAQQPLYLPSLLSPTDAQESSMARLPFSLLALSERVESVIGAIQTSLAMVADRSAADRTQDTHAAAELAAWRAHRPFIQHLASYPRYGPSMITDRDGESSTDGTDGSETLVSEEAAHTYYALPTAHEDRPTFVLGGKILPDIANFKCDREEEQARPDASDDSASDTDTFYSYDAGQSDSPLDVEANPAAAGLATTTRTAGPANRVPDLTEGVTALAPPPLWHSGRTRSKVVSVPRDAPGTCPIHGCADCGLCDLDKPLLFTI